MALCRCREAVNSLVLKLTKLMETRPVIRDLLQGLTTDELLQVWKMVLEMAYGIDDWIDPNLAMSMNLVESETEREQIREIQALIVESRAGCRRNGRLISREPNTIPGRGGEDLRNVFIRFGSLPVFVNRCIMDGDNNIAAASLSSRLVFLGANLLRKEEMRARMKPKRFVQIGSMQVELPT